MSVQIVVQKCAYSNLSKTAIDVRIVVFLSAVCTNSALTRIGAVQVHPPIYMGDCTLHRLHRAVIGVSLRHSLVQHFHNTVSSLRSL